MFENLDSMFETIEKIQPSNKRFGPDPRFWKLSRNDNDIGIARIRLLPGKITQDGEEKIVPYVRVYKYNVSAKPFGSKRFFEFESRESIGLPDPIAELRKELYKIGTDEAKKFLNVLKRSERFISNIYIVNDPIKKENNGQVKLWEYGVKLKDKFLGWLRPSKEDIALGAKPINVWDPIKGADIKLIMKKSGGFYNYDDTVHYDPAPLFEDKEKLKEVLESTYKLDEWLQEDHYMTYDEIVEKLHWIFEGKAEDILKSMGVSLYKGITTDNTIADPTKLNSSNEKVEEKPEVKSDTGDLKTEVSTSTTIDDDDDLSFLDD